MFGLNRPGWIRDAYEVTVRIDSEFTADLEQKASVLNVSPPGGYAAAAAQAADSLQLDRVPIVDAGGVLKGVVKITPPQGGTASYTGVRLTVIEYCATLRPSIAKNLLNYDIELSGAGQSKGEPVLLPFAIQLSDVPSLRETYFGTQFSVRHTLVATVLRPAWTFNITRHRALYLQRPVDSAAAAVNAAPPLLPELCGSDTPRTEARTLSVEACGGRVQFTLPTSVYSLEGEVEGKLSVEGLSSTAQAIALLVEEVEAAAMGPGDVLLRRGTGATAAITHTVFGTLTTASLLDTVTGKAKAHPAPSEAPTSTVTKGAQPEGVTGTQPPQDLKLPLEPARLHPTFALENSWGYRSVKGDLRYKLKLVVRDEGGRDHMDATELLLYRSHVSAGVDRTEGAGALVP